MSIDVQEAIKRSIQTEKNAMNFYQLGAQRMKNSDARKVFETLAREEREHAGHFYRFYKEYLANAQPTIELRLEERVVPIIEGILTDAGYVEEAVNVPNKGAIADLPDWIVVEVPATVGRNGVRPLPMGHLPKGFAGLLMNQVAVHDLTAEAVLQKSKAAALQALLVDPIVNNYDGIEEMLDTMIAYQERWLGYLK